MKAPGKRQYSISQISKFLDIPIETLRFFEKMGIVRPWINEDNRYRFYDAWDINYLVEYKYYRSLEFSMDETIQIQQKDDLAQLTQRMDAKQEYFVQRAHYYAMLQKRNDYMNQCLKSIPKRLGTIYTKNMEATDYIIHRSGDDYITIADLDGVLIEWWKYFAFLDRLLYIPQTRWEEKKHFYDSGFSISSKWIEEFKIPVNKKVRHLPACDAICTTVRFGRNGTFSLSVLDPLFDYIRAHNIPVCEDIFSTLLARTNDSDGYFRYFEFYIPLKNE